MIAILQPAPGGYRQQSRSFAVLKKGAQMKTQGPRQVQIVMTFTVALALAACGGAPDVDATDASTAGTATSQTAASDAIVEEAAAFMEGYSADLLGDDSDAIAARYSRRGAYLVFPGDRRLAPYDTIVRWYREGGPPPGAFEWRDLSYEVVAEDAVLVIGAFHWESAALDGMLGSYTALLVREDGTLRIRLENESFDNLPPPACTGRAEPCDLPLDAAALGRYTGEYDTPGGEGPTRVFAEDGRLMIQRPDMPPGRLLHEGGHAFRIEGAPSFRVLFDGGGERATSYVAFTGLLHTQGSWTR
jgi:hypothetical protein